MYSACIPLGETMDELNCAHPRRWCPGFDGLYQGNVCADYPEEARRTAKKKKKRNAKPKVVDTLL